MRANAGSRSVLAAALLALTLTSAADGTAPAEPASANPRAVAHSVVVTLLSTMLADEGIGEWGFAALVEADGHRVLVDTGARPQTVLANARELGIDLSSVPDVVLTHFHDDHVGGLLTLRREMMKLNRSALARAHVGRGIFDSRVKPDGSEANSMPAIRKEYEASGGRVIEYAEAAEIFPALWLTGPVPRVYPERNWSVGGYQLKTLAGLVEDTISEDQSLVINTAQGLIVVAGCGHAGIINTLKRAAAEFHDEPVLAVLGGIHLFAATDAQLDWTAEQMHRFHVSYLLGAHCTGLEAVYHLRQRLGLPRPAAVVGAVGARFVLGEGIHPGQLAQ